MQTTQLYLNSKYADVKINNSTSDVIFYVPQIEVDSQEQIYFEVKSLSIPLTYYNVNKSNDVLFWKYTNEENTYVANLDHGNYNINTFITMLKNKIYYYTIEGSSVINHYDFDISYNSIKNQIQFTNKINKNFTFLSGSSTCFNLLGFYESNITSVNYTLISNKAVNLITITNILISCNYLTYNIVKTDDLNNKNILCNVPIDVPVNSLLVYKGENSNKINTYKNTVSEIALTLYDQNKNIIDLNGSDWCMTLELSIINFVSEE